MFQCQSYQDFQTWKKKKRKLPTLSMHNLQGKGLYNDRTNDKTGNSLIWKCNLNFFKVKLVNRVVKEKKNLPGSWQVHVFHTISGNHGRVKFQLSQTIPLQAKNIS